MITKVYPISSSFGDILKMDLTNLSKKDVLQGKFNLSKDRSQYLYNDRSCTTTNRNTCTMTCLDNVRQQYLYNIQACIFLLYYRELRFCSIMMNTLQKFIKNILTKIIKPLLLSKLTLSLLKCTSQKQQISLNLNCHGKSNMTEKFFILLIYTICVHIRACYALIKNWQL